MLAGTARSGKSVGVLICVLEGASRGLATLLAVPTLSTSPAPALLRSWLASTDAVWDAGAGRWRFEGGGELTLAHRRAAPSGTYQVIGVDDLSAFREDDYARLLSLRASGGHGAPRARMRAAASPDGEGREWVAQRFSLAGAGTLGAWRRVVRASFETNPHVDAAGLASALSGLPEPRRTWLLAGDWTVPAPQEEDHSDEAGPTALALPDGGEQPVRLRVPMGRSDSHDVWFDPYRPERPLANCHVLATGETGSGKTQTVMALAAELRAKGVSPVMVDFSKDDYCGEWAAEQGLAVLDPAIGCRLPFNPLAPTPDPSTGYVNGVHQIHRAIDIVKRVWRLGDQQAFRVREAAKAAFQEAGLPLDPRPRPQQRRWPGLREVIERLDPEDPTRGRLSPLVDLDPFDASAEGGLANLLDGGAVVRLTGLPGDEAKASVGEFLLLALDDAMRARGHVRGLRWLLGLDEAHRIAQSPFLEPLLRESRAFGLGLMLATQFPRDLSLVVKGCCATQLYFGQTQLEQIAEIQRAVYGETRGREAQRLATAVRDLKPLHAVAHSRGRWGVVRITPYHERFPSISGWENGYT